MQIQRSSWDHVRDRWAKWFFNSSKLRWIFQDKEKKSKTVSFFYANYLGENVYNSFLLTMQGRTEIESLHLLQIGRHSSSRRRKGIR